MHKILDALVEAHTEIAQQELAKGIKRAARAQHVVQGEFHPEKC
jgi:hypothetical protein